MSPRPRKRPWSQPLADLVGAVIDPVLARQGFSESDLILHWDDIVGERLASASRPIKLAWPPRPPGRLPEAPPQSATLVVRVEGAFAVELQHQADQVLARINAHLGWRCVGKLTFKQGPIERRETLRTRPTPSVEALAGAAKTLPVLADEPLRAALAHLGAHVLKG